MRKNKFSLVTLDISILTAGRVDLFEKCIRAILPQMKPEYRIHVFNNGSNSDEYEKLYKLLPEHSKIIRNRNNDGYPAGANGAIRSGNAPLVLFISDDIFIHDGAIEKLLDRMNFDPTIGMCGYKLLFPTDSDDPTRPAGKVQHIGQATNIKGEIIHPLIGWDANHPKTQVSRDVLGVTGATFIVRRDAFRRAGGFRLEYGKGYYEDVDLALTMRSMGYRIFIDANATATHGVAQTFAQSPISQQDLMKNKMIFNSRWLSNNLPWTEYEMW